MFLRWLLEDERGVCRKPIWALLQRLEELFFFAFQPTTPPLNFGKVEMHSKLTLPALGGAVLRG